MKASLWLWDKELRCFFAFYVMLVYFFVCMYWYNVMVESLWGDYRISFFSIAYNFLIKQIVNWFFMKNQTVMYKYVVILHLRTFLGKVYSLVARVTGLSTIYLYIFYFKVFLLLHLDTMFMFRWCNHSMQLIALLSGYLVKGLRLPSTSIIYNETGCFNTISVHC